MKRLLEKLKGLAGSARRAGDTDRRMREAEARGDRTGEGAKELPPHNGQFQQRWIPPSGGGGGGI